MMMGKHTQEDAVFSLFWQMVGTIISILLLVGGSFLYDSGVKMSQINPAQ